MTNIEMKTLKTILSAAGVLAIAALAMVSCSKDESAQAGGLDRTGTISVSVSGLMGKYSQDEGTKTGLVSNVRVSWEAGDKVYAFDGSKCLGELNVSLKDGKDYYALLTGDLLEPAAGTTKITLVYASGFSATQGQAITDGKLSFDISSQSSGSDTDNTPFVAFGTLDYTEGAPSLNKKVVDFTLATSVMRLNCIGLEASAAITGAELIGMSDECVLNVSNAGAAVGQGAIGDISLSFADGFKASASGAQVIYAAIAKNSTASEQSLEVQQAKTYEWSFGSRAREAAKSINAICQMTEQPYITIEVTESEGRTFVKNTGNIDAYVRASFIANWVNAEEEIVAPSNGTLTLSDGWVKDGIFYNYTNSDLAPGSEVCFVESYTADAKPAGADHLSITVIGQGRETEWE